MAPSEPVPRSWNVRLVVPPAAIALAVTLLRLLGELRGWRPLFFVRDAGGLGGVVGIIWLAPLVGIHLARRLLREGAGPVRPVTASVHGLGGAVLFLAFGLFALSVWPPYRVQVTMAAVIATAIVALQLRGWAALARPLLVYAVASRLPVVVVMFFAISGAWGTHYDAFPPGFPIVDPLQRWLWGGVVVQMTLWVGVTVLLGAMAGGVTAALTRQRQAGQ